MHSGVSWLPLYHDMGLIGALVTALITPGTRRCCLLSALCTAWRLEALSESGATISVAPNFAHGLCADRVDDLDGLDLSNWMIVCGAEPVIQGRWTVCSALRTAGCARRRLSKGWLRRPWR